MSTVEQVRSTFSYRARDASGEIVTGTVIATDIEDVGARLRAEGKFVLAVQDKPMRALETLDRTQIERNQAARQVKRDDVIAFCQQMSVMLETGVPLAEALDAFCVQMPRREFRIVLAAIREDVFAGEQFSRAMAKWPRVFPNMIVSLMRASEASGTMSLMMGRVGAYLAKERRTAQQIKGALGYPLFMMTCAVGMTIFLVAFVLPRFARIYESRAAALPLPTRILLSVSEFFTTQYAIYVPALIVLGVIGVLAARSASVRRRVDWIKLRAPVLRSLFGQLYLTRATRTMSTLLSAGVNLLDIIDLCRGVTSNVHYAELWNLTERGVRDGHQISETFSACPFIPSSVASMIASGERSGRIAEVMDRIAEHSEQELELTVKRVTGYLEPIMIIFMGVMIGGLALALLLPIFSMGRVMTSG